MVADWVYHDNPGNPHIHLMTTLRPLTEDGFGTKKVTVTGEDGQPLRNKAGKIVYELWAGGTDDFNAFRDAWFERLNHHLALNGISLRVDGRSYEKQGIDLEPTIHLGVGAKAIERKAEKQGVRPELERIALNDARRAENTRRISSNPAIVLDLITREKSVFDERDVAKVLYRYVDDPAVFQQLMLRIIPNRQVLRLQRDTIDFATGAKVPARYSTREMIRLEATMARQALWLSGRETHGVDDKVLVATFARHERLSDEQKAAIERIAGSARIAAVVGRAGAGKTTMMKAAREAGTRRISVWSVVPLPARRPRGLEKEAGIVSRTLASWELRWQQGRGTLDARTVFVMDEAGMVASKQMAGFAVEAVVKAGAKIVLVGDPEQLQPIEAGAAFRAIVDRIGYAELETIYRQREAWMRHASLDLARGNIEQGLLAYRTRGHVVGESLKSEAVESLIAAWNHDYDPAKSMLMLAHLRRDVLMLNIMARAKLVERGIVGDGHAFKTADGIRLDAGDQIVFLKNEGSLGVKNGMTGRVIEAAPNRIAVAVGEGGQRRLVTVEQRFYNNVDHGYATTIHKSQGATVDRVKVLASLSPRSPSDLCRDDAPPEDLELYFGRRSFEMNGGLAKILSRRNAKETTLDYERGTLYREALRFAENRGLHIVHVARTLLRDRLDWTLSQKKQAHRSHQPPSRSRRTPRLAAILANPISQGGETHGRRHHPVREFRRRYGQREARR